jgi:exodeoxyribonuclease V alpha subunit
MNQPEKIKGTVERFIFQSPENGFSVIIVRLRDQQITATGNLSAVHAGQEVELEGSWNFHAKFGKQFVISSYKSCLPTTTSGLKKYLGSGLIKGIGKTYADRLVNAFGSEILNIIEHTPHRMAEVEGIGEKRINTITQAWKDQKEIANIMIFLQDKGISPAYAVKIYKKYGQESIAVLHENPYRLADEIWGIGFKTADAIAQKMGFAPTCLQRLASGILYALTSASNQGHLYVELENLREQTLTLLELAPDDKALLKNALHDLYNREKIKLIVKQEKNFIGPVTHYYSEVNLAKRLLEINYFPSTMRVDIEKIYTNLRAPEAEEINLNEKQQMGVLAALQNKVTIITGGPGTGKTTLLKKLLSILDREKISYKVAAPTGRAAKRITEGTGRYASTIHRLLEFDASTMRFVHNESNALKLDYLIVDEASMIDIFLALALIKATPLNAHILIIGDHDQLPSVGPGNFLKDCIMSDKFATIHLTEIFRQAQDSLIVVNAHRVNKGEFPTPFLPHAKKDFIYIKESNPENIVSHIKKLLFIELKKHNLNPTQAQILVPMNRGAVGTHALNHHIQEMLNPEKKPSINRMGVTYKEGDRIMQIRNNYDKHVFNGDLGIIETIDPEEQQIFVNFSDHMVEYEFSELDELVLAYATTIHKSQGSEYPAVIIPIFMQHFTLLQRNLIYTAITRAKKLCIIVGDSRALGMAIKNNKIIQRLTFLADFLKEATT